MKKGSGRRRERRIPEQDQEQDDTLGAATTCWWYPQHQKSLPVKARKREKTGKASIKCGILSAEKGFRFHTPESKTRGEVAGSMAEAVKRCSGPQKKTPPEAEQVRK
jgi:hypothetical protein